MRHVDYDDIAQALIYMYDDDAVMLSECMQLLLSCKNFRLSNAVYRVMAKANRCILCGEKLETRELPSDYIDINGEHHLTYERKKYCSYCDIMLDNWLNV